MSARPLEASRPRQVRKNKIIKTSLQFRVVGAFMAVACVAALFQVLLTNHAMMDIVRASPVVGDQMLALVPGLLVRNLAITLGVLIPVTLVVGILVTHRIAGPVFSMERYLLRIAAGKPIEGPCRLRDRDNFRELCQAMNAAVARLGGELPGSPMPRAGVVGELDDISSLVSRPSTTSGESVAPTGQPKAQAESD